MPLHNGLLWCRCENDSNILTPDYSDGFTGTIVGSGLNYAQVRAGFGNGVTGTLTRNYPYFLGTVGKAFTIDFQVRVYNGELGDISSVYDDIQQSFNIAYGQNILYVYLWSIPCLYKFDFISPSYGDEFHLTIVCDSDAGDTNRIKVYKDETQLTFHSVYYYDNPWTSPHTILIPLSGDVNSSGYNPWMFDNLKVWNEATTDPTLLVNSNNESYGFEIESGEESESGEEIESGIESGMEIESGESGVESGEESGVESGIEAEETATITLSRGAFILNGTFKDYKVSFNDGIKQTIPGNISIQFTGPFSETYYYLQIDENGTFYLSISEDPAMLSIAKFYWNDNTKQMVFIKDLRSLITGVNPSDTDSIKNKWVSNNDLHNINDEISNEASDRMSADAHLQIQIDALSISSESGLEQETINRINADAYLQSQIDDLESGLDVETQERMDADDNRSFQNSVKDIVGTLPGSPNEGDRYIYLSSSNVNIVPLKTDDSFIVGGTPDQSGHPAYFAFDRNDSSYSLNTTAGTPWNTGYNFLAPTSINSVRLKLQLIWASLPPFVPVSADVWLVGSNATPSPTMPWTNIQLLQSYSGTAGSVGNPTINQTYTITVPHSYNCLGIFIENMVPGYLANGQVDFYSIEMNQSQNINVVAEYRDSSWVYFTPELGWTTYVDSLNDYRMFDGTNWVQLPAISALESGLNVETQERILADENLQAEINGLESGLEYVSNLLNEGTSLGWSTEDLVDCAISENSGGMSVLVDSGKGYLLTGTYPDYYPIQVNWNSQDISLSPNSDVYIYVNSSGTMLTSASLPDTLHNVILGRVVTDGTSVDFIENSSIIMNHMTNRNLSFLTDIVGGVFGSGCIVSESTSSGYVDALDVTSGTYYFGIEPFNVIGQSPITFESYWRKAGTGYWGLPNQTSVDVLRWDNGNGTLVPVPEGYFAKHSLYAIGGVQTKFFFVYSQATYDTLVAAQEGGIPTPPEFIRDAVVLISTIITNYSESGTNNIVEIHDDRPRFGFKPSSVSSITKHGDLTGLLNDDHPQYLNLSGVRPMQGNLNMNGFSITGITWGRDVFKGNGGPGPYPLTFSPQIGNEFVFVAKVIQDFGPDYSITTGVSPSITFTFNITSTQEVIVRYMR